MSTSARPDRPGTGLPAGLRSRPLRMEDAAAVHAVIAAQELADVGEVGIEVADLLGDWQRPSYDLSASSVAVLAENRIVGYAETGGGRGDAAVHPEHRGHGIGTWLALRMQELARAGGLTEIGMPVAQGSPGDRLLAGLGYRVRWTSWMLALPEQATIPGRPLPAGYAVRTARPAEHRDCWQVVEDAFGEWAARAREPFADWAAGTVRRPGFEPWHLRVVAGPDDRVAACAVLAVGEETAAVAQLATRADARHRGLAQALLADSFALARGHGARRCELATDSRTGALELYRRVGMEVTSTWLNRAVTL